MDGILNAAQTVARGAQTVARGDSSEQSAEVSGTSARRRFRGRHVSTAVTEGTEGHAGDRAGGGANPGATGAQRGLRSMRAAWADLSLPSPEPATSSLHSRTSPLHSCNEASAGTISGDSSTGNDSVEREASAPPSRRGFVDLPWLTPELNEARREMAVRPAGPRRRRTADPSIAVSFLSEIERDIRRADALIERMRTELLTNAEWREMESLVRYYRQRVSGSRLTLRELLYSLAQNEALSWQDACQLDESLETLVETHDYLGSGAFPWADLSRQHSLMRTDGADTHRMVLTSRVIPATAFGAYLAAGCPDAPGPNPPRHGQQVQVPHLLLTSLMEENGRTLFTGLRHAIIHAGIASSELEYTKEQACRKLAVQTAAAALVADPEKFRSALEGNRVDLGLTSISLLRREDLGQWEDQYRAFAGLERTGPIALTVRNPEGKPQTVMANVRVRQFAVSANDEPLDGEPVYENYRRCLPDTLERLFGPGQSPGPGGEVEQKVDAMKAHLRNWRGEIEEKRRANRRAIAEGGSGACHALLEKSKIEAEARERNFEVQRTRALKDAAEQVKSVVTRDGGPPAGSEGLEKVAARIALVTHLTGEMPLLNCTAGHSFTQHLDSEIKWLAAAAAIDKGKLPPLDIDSRVAAMHWQEFVH